MYVSRGGPDLAQREREALEQFQHVPQQHDQRALPLHWRVEGGGWGVEGGGGRVEVTL